MKKILSLVLQSLLLLFCCAAGSFLRPFHLQQVTRASTRQTIGNVWVRVQAIATIDDHAESMYFGVGSGTGPLGGGSNTERNLNRWTIFFCLVFVLNTIVLIKLS